MFTVRQRDPTIRGVFRQVKHPTSRAVTRRHGPVTVGASGTLTSMTSPLCKLAPARIDETSSYLAVS